jgi:DNA replication and repair protein RecF
VTRGVFDGHEVKFCYGQLRRRLLFDGIEQRVFADYLAMARVVSFANADIELVRGSSEPRRRYADFLGMQINATYRPTLRAYERASRARNALLKSPTPRLRERAAYDAPLIEHGARLRQLRLKIAVRLAPQAADAYARISGEEEKFEMHFRPGAGDDLGAELEQCAQKRIDYGKLWSAHIAIISNYASTRW